MNAANVALDDNNLQVAFIIRVTPTKATRLVVVMCPFCERLHVHGWPYRSGPPGTRVAHCAGSGLIRSYEIKAPR